MKIGGIGNDDNSFIKKMLEEGRIGSDNTNANEKIGGGANQTGEAPKTEEADKINKTGIEDGAASYNGNQNSNSLIDRSQFTSDDELQELDLQDFEDDFR